MADLWKAYAEAAIIDLGAALAQSGQQAMEHLIDAAQEIERALDSFGDDDG